VLNEAIASPFRPPIPGAADFPPIGRDWNRPRQCCADRSMGFFLVRLLLSLAFVFATYNPTGYSFYHWIIDFDAGLISLKAVVALALAMLYYAIFRVVFAAFRRSGLIVAGLAAVLFVSEVVSILVPQRTQPFWHLNILLTQYVILCAVAIVVSLGLSWSHLIEQLTGQLQKRYVPR
jgi:uncharacterized protein DUF6524